MEREHLILLIEDNYNDEIFTLRALKAANVLVRVHLARDGNEALDYIFDLSTRCPDLILLDLKLPKVSGLEVLKAIRIGGQACRVPVVVFTSSNEQSDVDACFDAGANGYVHKSVEFDKYMEKVSKVAEYWLTVNEPIRHGPQEDANGFILAS